jgi:hypothetical protein
MEKNAVNPEQGILQKHFIHALYVLTYFILYILCKITVIEKTESTI